VEADDLLDLLGRMVEQRLDPLALSDHLILSPAGRPHRHTQESPMESRNATGPLVVIGGAEEKTRNGCVLRRFVELCGGSDANIVVMPLASEIPKEVGAAYVEVFNGLGAAAVTPVHIVSRDDANDPYVGSIIEEATGIFFTGGDQVRITRLLGGTKLDTLLHQRHREGLAIGGTSAGATMMSAIMIVGDIPNLPLRVGMTEIYPGMEFLPGTVIDQHFEQRGRLRRLLAAVAQYPHHVGIGVDENTALVVEGDQFVVIGEGAVTVIDMGTLSHTNLPQLGKGDLIALCGITTHILPAGYRYDLTNRKCCQNTPQVPAHAPAAASRNGESSKPRKA
jgi:cyanophycinase